MKTLRILTIALLCITTYTVASYGARLLTRLAKVHIQNLDVGADYSSKELGNFTVDVFNDSELNFDVVMEVMAPNKAELEQGYEAIPDVSWIKLEQDKFNVTPQHWISAPVSISIPDNKEYLGKKYQAYILSRTLSPEGQIGLGIGLKSKVMITINDTVPEAGQEKRTISGDIHFLTEPEMVHFKDVRIARQYTLADSLEKRIRIKNQSDGKLTYKVESIDAKESLLPVDRLKDYEAGIDPNDIVVDTPEFELNPGEEKDIAFTLQLPKKKEYRQKNLMYILNVTQGNVGKYIRVYVSTL